MRRVTVVTPHVRVDLSLPPRSSIAELVPQLVRLSATRARAALPSGGWELRRLGGPALPPSSTVDDAGIRDGDLLYLDPASPASSPHLFDDVVDAIAGAAAERSAWGPEATRRAAGIATALAFVAAAALLGSVLPWPAAPIAGAGLAAALLGAGGAVARALRDPAAGAALAIGGLAGACVSGPAALDGPGAPHRAGELLTAALAAGAGYSVLAAIVVAGCTAWFAGAAVACGTGAAATAITLSTGIRPAATAAVALVCATVLSPALPALALRLGRLPLPPVPADMASFRGDERVTPGPEVRARTRTAQDVLSALLAALAVLALGAATMLLRAGTTGWAWALPAVAGLAMVLRARAYLHVAQRGPLLAAGVAALAGTGVRAATGAGMLVFAGLLAATVLAGLVCTGYAVRARSGAPSPYWSRLLDALELAALLSLVPLAAAVLGLFTAVRAWVG